MAETPKSGAPEQPDFRRVRGMDPAANWLLGPGLDDYLPEPETDMVPMLLELDDDDAVSAFRALLDEAIILGFGSKNDRIQKGELLPVVVTQKWLTRLLDESAESETFRNANKRIALSSPMGPPQNIKSFLGPIPLANGDALRGPIVAAIDDGFAFAHERFRDANDWSRIEYFWDMNHDFPVLASAPGEFTKAEIDELIGGGADEDEIYQRAGLLDYGDARHKPLAWRVSHGTHVLDLATGSEPADGLPPIIAAQLPSPVVARTTGELLDFYVWLGVLYILYRAGDQPVVINISFGYDAGPHDGQGLLEKHLSKLADERDEVYRRKKTVVVLPAGNAQLSRCHATIDPKRGAPVELDWIVQPEDRTHSIIEIWLPRDPEAGERIKLTVVLPDGTSTAPMAEPVYSSAGNPPPPPTVLGDPDRPMGLVELWERRDGRRMFRIAIAPTARAQPDPRALAPAGRWTLRFEAGPNELNGPAHAWVQRDDSLYGYPQSGRQSYFDHEDYVRFDDHGHEMDDDPPARPCPITRRSLLNAIATSEHVVVAGGYQSRDGRIARYSCGGPNVSPPEPAGRLKPDALLPSDGSPAHPGVLAAGARSGARVAMDGTSVASPQLARYIACWLAGNSRPRHPRDAVKIAVRKYRVPRPIPTSSDRDGHGRLDRLDPPLAERFEPGD